MDRQKELITFVKRAKRSLNVEKMLPLLQYGIFLSILFSLAILIISRFFVFPYYDETAFVVACATIVSTFVYMWQKRIRMKEALRKLDVYYPFNELVTALSFQQHEHPLAESIMNKAVKESDEAYERFKNRPKQYWRPKALLGILFASILLTALWIFPSETQQEAQGVEKERTAIQEMKKEVAKLEKKAKSEDVKKKMRELQEKLKEAETAEEALREVVKKQKELTLLEQKLKEKQLAEKGEGEGLSNEELQKLKDLGELQNALAQNALSTQTYLSKLGKPISFDLQNTISQMNESKSSQSQNASTSSKGTGNIQGNQQQNNRKKAQGNTGSGNTQGSNGNGNQQNQGSNGNGNQQNQGSNGNGNGSNQGVGSGAVRQGGSFSSGAGLGAGGRTLLSVPSERLGGSSGPTVDGGPLGEGDPADEQKGSVPATKGTVRPYEEVIGVYEERYLQSAKRLQLPKDLQNVVESYFSSIQSEE